MIPSLAMISPKKSKHANVLPVVTATPLPSKVKRFRINVPASMDAGDIMTIKLDDGLTKILITAPTTAGPTTKKLGSSRSRQTTPKSMKDDFATAPPSPTLTSCSNSTVASSMTPTSSSSSLFDPTTTTDKYSVAAETPSPSALPPAAAAAVAAALLSDDVIASSDVHVSEGKRIIEAKKVVVIHAVFPQTDSTLKDAMVDEIMRCILQEGLNCGCNYILGLTITIKVQKAISGFLVKASGTPCLVMPTQVVLSSIPLMSGSTTTTATAINSSSNRVRTSSIDDATGLTRRQ